jgi:REP element-mobilizing transposase RayT
MWEGPLVPRPLMRSDAHSRNLRLHRLSDTPATFFITNSLRPKKPILDEVAREIVVNALAYSVQQERIYLRSFAVMPDHWHALFALREPWTLPKFMHALMSYVAGKTSASYGLTKRRGKTATMIRASKHRNNLSSLLITSSGTQS